MSINGAGTVVSEITIGANGKYFTLAQNGLRAIVANQSNYVELSLVITFPISVENNYHCP